MTAAIATSRPGLVELAARCGHGPAIIAARRLGPRRGSGALRVPSSQPSRILTVTGTQTAPATAAMIRSAGPNSRISAEPDRPLVTFLAGQPSEVDDRPLPFAEARRLGHRRRLAPASSPRCARSRSELGLGARPRARLQHVAARHHLGHNRPAPGRSARSRKGKVGNPGHRCQKQTDRNVRLKSPNILLNPCTSTPMINKCAST